VVAVVILACIGLIVALAVGRHAWGVMPGMWGGWRYTMPHMRTYAQPMFMFGPLLGLAALAVIGGLIWLALSGSRRASSGTAAPEAPRALETPLDVLKRRYAAGEIDREQYEQMRQDLE
jgi:putative membrane protein